MKVFDNSTIELLMSVGNRDQQEDVLLVVKLVNPGGKGVWYISKCLNNIDLLFGYIDMGYPVLRGWALFSLERLEKLRCPPHDYAIRRDLDFVPTRFSKLFKPSDNFPFTQNAFGTVLV